MKTIRNRIVEHIQVRARELVPHPQNFRRHPDRQRETLIASYQEVGFARSLLGFRRADGKIQLIDGHLRRDIDPNMLVTVEVLDVDEAEARQLLLTIDSLAGLAQQDEDVLAELRDMTQSDSQVLNDFWQSLTSSPHTTSPEVEESRCGDQFFVLVECGNEEQQMELLKRLVQEGLQCKALVN